MKKLTQNCGTVIVVVILAALFIFPLYILFKISVSVPSEIFAEKPPYLIKDFTLAHFRDVFASGAGFFVPLKKSILTAVMASVLSLLLSIPAAYAISKLDYRMKYGLLVIIFMSRMIPEVSIALPVSISFIRMGFFDTVTGLALAHVIRILPVTCFILVGTFSAVPEDLEKQAQVDGCSPLTALIRIVLPLTAGGISVAGIFSFLLSWDEFIYASYLCLAKPTMPLKMYYYVSRGDIFYSATYAVIITLPVLILTMAIQRHIRPEYLSGAIKG